MYKRQDPDFINLAGPPSLDSCTRDIYQADTRFTPAALLAMVQGVASAVQHLHGRGILHGDLYAHNMLHSLQGEGRLLLGDFGGGGAPRFYRDCSKACCGGGGHLRRASLALTRLALPSR
ncbi:hypothetical protein KAM461_39770 [Aeromonas hydrophila]|nr:hypothetical protein KAM461_39770 [Aeromonas hydrophila]